MTPLIAASSWPWWAFLALAWFAYDLINKKIQATRSERIAQVEADLKLKLAQRLQDPELVERVLATKIQIGDDSQDENENIAEAARRAAVEIHTTTSGQPVGSATRAHQTVGWGLTLFLMGGAFILAALPFAAGIAELWIPGLILAAIGLSLITFATMQKDIRKHVGLEEEGRTETGN